MQQVHRAADGTVRFRANAIVRFLTDSSRYDLNTLADMSFSGEDWTQFAQLIGYSVNGFCELSYVPNKIKDRAEAKARQLLRHPHARTPSPCRALPG